MKQCKCTTVKREKMNEIKKGWQSSMSRHYVHDKHFLKKTMNWIIYGMGC